MILVGQWLDGNDAEGQLGYQVSRMDGILGKLHVEKMMITMLT